MPTTVKGSCLCGSVKYEATGEAQHFYHCHCQRCRKATGTYKLERWFNLPELADEARAWLQQLPKPVARDIAYDNAARLFQ